MALWLGGVAWFLSPVRGVSPVLAAAAGQAGTSAPQEQSSPESPGPAKTPKKQAKKEGAAASPEPKKIKAKKSVSRGYGGGEIRHRPSPSGTE